jgi:hypothetical protein
MGQDLKFNCPGAGTLMEGTSSGSTFKTKYIGADSNAPTVCRRTDLERQTDGSFIYNFYDLKFAASPAPIQASMDDLFSGRKNSVEFQRHSTLFGGTDFIDTWTNAGREQIQIAGRKINAWIFNYELRGLRSAYHAKRKIWYDPATGLYVKSTYQHLDGAIGTAGPWEATSISIP